MLELGEPIDLELRIRAVGYRSQSIDEGLRFPEGNVVHDQHTGSSTGRIIRTPCGFVGRKAEATGEFCRMIKTSPKPGSNGGERAVGLILA